MQFKDIVEHKIYKYLFEDKMSAEWVAKKNGLFRSADIQDKEKIKRALKRWHNRRNNRKRL